MIVDANHMPDPPDRETAERRPWVAPQLTIADVSDMTMTGGSAGQGNDGVGTYQS